MPQPCDPEDLALASDRALARVVATQQAHPLSTFFGDAGWPVRRWVKQSANPVQRDTSASSSVMIRIEDPDDLDRAQEVPDAGDALEAEAVQEERADTTENRVVGSRQGGVVRTVLARQLLGFCDYGGEAVPGKNGLDGGEGVATGIASAHRLVWRGAGSCR